MPCHVTIGTHKFEVVAGKIEGDGERNYKYIESFPTLDAALVAHAKCQGYHFVDIEYRAEDGKRYSLDPRLLPKN